jgi:hypothetical protein
MELVYGAKNKVQLLSSAFAVIDGAVRQGQTVGLSIVRFVKQNNEKGLLLYNDAKENLWKASLASINYEEGSDELTVTFNDSDTGKIYPIRFATLEERSKTLSYFEARQRTVGKGKGEQDSDEEVRIDV